MPKTKSQTGSGQFDPIQSNLLVPTVLEKTAGGERAYDIYSRLLKDRIIMLDTDVNSHSSSIITSQLLFLESQDPDADILFYINSPGGSVTAGMAIYDTMNFIKCDVSTIVMGQAASMGSCLASAGAKGKRYILPNARHMIHQPLGGASGQATEVEIQYKELQRWKEVLTNIYVETTGQDYLTLETDMDRDNFMTAQESLDYGLCDEIITQR